MIRTRNELKTLVLQGAIQAPIDAVHDSHVDVTLGKDVLLEVESNSGYVDLAAKEELCLDKHMLPYVLAPKQFALFELANYIRVPLDCTAEFYLDSGLARRGVEQLAADLLVPGWGGILTLELLNVTKFHSLKFSEGMNIGKIVFHHHKLTEGYKGKYQNQTGVQS